MPSTSSDRHSGKTAGTSPDSHKANRSCDNPEANRSSQLAAPGTVQPSFMASSAPTNADTKDVGVSTHQVSIYVDEEIVDTSETKTAV
jgi:hypothetical protein